MNPTAEFLLLLVAFVAFVLAAANFPARVNLVAAGLAVWVFIPLYLALKAL